MINKEQHLFLLQVEKLLLGTWLAAYTAFNLLASDIIMFFCLALTLIWPIPLAK